MMLFQQVLDAARALGVTEIEAIVSEETQALTRFANNAIHQNVSERSTQLSVRAVIDGRTARATTNRLDRDGIRDVVAEAIAITRLTESDADLLPLAEPAEIEGGSTVFREYRPGDAGRARAGCGGGHPRGVGRRADGGGHLLDGRHTLFVV